MTSPQNILVIGAGELGYQVLRFLVQYPKQQDITVSMLLRPASPSLSPDSHKQKQIDRLQKLGIRIVPADIVKDDEHKLSSIFARYYQLYRFCIRQRNTNQTNPRRLIIRHQKNHNHALHPLAVRGGLRYHRARLRAGFPRARPGECTT